MQITIEDSKGGWRIIDELPPGKYIIESIAASNESFLVVRKSYDKKWWEFWK